MITVELEHFSLDKICDSGQCFRMRKLGDGHFSMVAGDQYLEMYQKDGVVDFCYPQAKKELMKLCGVGEKVAECICLFALHHMDAFPIDTHIRQVMDVHYKRGFPNRRYRGMRGIMQQYIFYYDLYS